MEELTEVETSTIVLDLQDKSAADQQMCRLCAGETEKYLGIYDEEGLCNDLANKINLYLPIKVSESDRLPMQCCWNCATTVINWHELVLASIEADKHFRSLLLNSTTEEEEDQDLVSLSVTETVDDVDLVCADDVICYDEVETEYAEPQPSPDPDLEEEEEAADDPNDVKPMFKEDPEPECLPKSHDQEEEYDEMRLIEAQMKAEQTKSTKRKRTAEVSPSTKDGAAQEKRLGNRRTTQHICVKCEGIFKSASALNQHDREEHADEADFDYDEIRLKVEQEWSESSEAPTEEALKTMDDDGRESIVGSKMKGRRTSRRVCESQLENYEIVADANNAKAFRCTVCSAVFKFASMLLMHQSIHTGEREHCCHICGKSFRLSYGLKHHIDEYHLKIKKHECEVCHMRFTSKAFRNEHMNIHTGVRPFVCDICGKAFKQSGSLHVHKLFHSNIFRFECDQCDKKYRRATDLKIHTRLHTGEKPYKCELCGAAFTDSKGLRTHVKIHDRSQEHTCNICGNKFKQERYLKNHMRNHRKKSNVVAPSMRLVTHHEEY